MRCFWYLVHLVHWWAGRIGYIVRPYDMILDRRRWFWQRTPDGGWYSGPDRPSQSGTGSARSLPGGGS